MNRFIGGFGAKWDVIKGKFTQQLNAFRTSTEGKFSAMVYGALKATVSAMSQEELIASRDAALGKNEKDDGLEDVDINDITSEDLSGQEGQDDTAEKRDESGLHFGKGPCPDRQRLQNFSEKAHGFNRGMNPPFLF